MAEESDTNPTEEWIYTYLLLEVDAPERHLDVVSETLTRNGWQTRESFTILKCRDSIEFDRLMCGGFGVRA